MKYLLKKYFLLLFANCIFFHAANAQFSANLLLNSRPPSYLSDWNSGLAGQLIITYTGQAPARVKLTTQLQNGSGNPFAVSNNATAQLLQINTGPNVVRIDRVLQLENLRFPGGGNSLATSGKLPTGQYSLTVQLLSINDSVLTPVIQHPFTQVNYQLPYLLTPVNKAVLDAAISQTAITFRWSSLVPASQENVTYRLQVYEVLTAQTSMQALRSNQPLLLADIRRTTQYIWRPQLYFKDSAIHPFIWTVQTLDSRGVPIPSSDENNQGRSESSEFSINTLKPAASD